MTALLEAACSGQTRRFTQYKARSALPHFLRLKKARQRLLNALSITPVEAVIDHSGSASVVLALFSPSRPGEVL